MLTKLYLTNLDLFRDVLFEKIAEHTTFIHLRGVYPDEWYNFIVPHVQLNQFDFTETEDLVNKEKSNGYKLSYYIHDNLNESYATALSRFDVTRLATECYITLKLNSKYDADSSHIKQLTRDMLDDYLEASATCFHDWPNNKSYSEKFFKLMTENPYPKKEFNTFVAIDDGKVVSYGSIIVDHSTQLGYLHNSATLEGYRRKGYHTELIKRRCNWALDKGIKNVYAIVEEDGASFMSMRKLGFELDSKFHIYSKLGS